MNNLDPLIIKKLQKICGSEYVVTDENLMTRYTTDETKALEKKVELRFPDVVVKPETPQQVSEILKLASKEELPVTPRGGGTGESGGTVPIRGGIVLSLERLDDIIEIDTENLMAVVEAGVTLEALYDAVEEVGLYFPPHPGDEGAFIGGAVTTNAAGARCVRYGPIRNYVMGLQVVLAGGQILNLSGKLLKNNTGYALRHLIVGSEGTLGVITKVTLRLMPSSLKPTILLVSFEKIQKSVETVSKVIRSGIIPLGVEYVSKESIDLSEEYLDRKWPTETGICSLMFFITGETEDVIQSKSEKIMEIAMIHGALAAFLATERGEIENVLEIRSKMGEAMKEHEIMETFDISVPPAKVAELMWKTKEISEKYNVKIPTLGHVADGNVHHELFPTDIETFNKVKRELFETTARLGGVITGEHGVGVTKIDDLHFSRSDKELELMREIKKVFDPKNILNPGKVIPERRNKQES